VGKKRNGKAQGCAGAALGAFAVKSVKEFGSFEKGMQEVFTLLPGFSKDAMDAMSQDVLNLSNKMGVLPEEIVPSLYQALSAGVPAGNVFDFLEVSIKGAKAGVATTAESVDLLTSVTNAYGRENLSVAKASDIIFTTIKEGKTTFTELAGAIYQVGPVAANAGVSFEDVGSAIAALTAQGVPTRVATTQIRQAILALASPNKALAETLANTTGEVYELKEIMQRPGGLLKAFQRLKEVAGGDAMNIKSFMGSVEGLQAMMAITAKGGEKFTQTMIAMGGAAGATQTAYGVMDKGILRSFEKIKAALKVTMINMGKSLAPFVQAAVPTIIKIIGMIQSIPWTKILQGFARVWLIGIKPYADAIWKMLKRLPWHLLIDTLLPIAGMVVKTIQNLGSAIIRLGPMIIPGLRALAGYFSFIMLKFFVLSKVLKEFAPQIAQIFRAVFQVAAKAFEFFINPSAQKFKELVDLIKSRFGHLGKSIGAFLLTVKDFIISNFKIIAAGIVEGFHKLLGGVWEQFKAFLMGDTDVGQAIKRFHEMFTNLKSELSGEMAELKTAFGALFKAIAEAFNFGSVAADNQKHALAGIKEVAFLLITGLTGLVEAFGFLIVAMMRIQKWGAMVAKDLMPLLKVTIGAVAIVLGLLAAQIAVAAAVSAGLWTIIGKIVQGLSWLLKKLHPVIEALIILGKIFAWVAKFIGKIWWAVVKTVFLKFKDLVMLVVLTTIELVKDLALAWWDGIKKIVGHFETLKEGIGSALQFIKDKWSIAWEFMKEFALRQLSPILSIFDALKKKVWHVLFGGTVTKDFEKAFGFIGSIADKVIGSVIRSFQRMKDFASAIFSDIAKAAQKAMKFAGKIFKGVGGALGSIVSKVVGGGGAPAGAQVRGSGGTINTSTLQTSLRPIIEKLTSMDITLKSIDRKLSGKFVNQ